MRGTVVIAPSESVADLPTDLSGQILMRVVSVTQDITPLAVAAAARGAVAVIATRVGRSTRARRPRSLRF